MSEEPRIDDGILGKARRLADQVGDYARSDEARAKLDVVKKNAIKAGGIASAGAKKLVEEAKVAASQAKDKADEFAKSEQVQVVRAKAKAGWDEIQGGTFRGSRISKSPLVVGLAIFCFFPLGIYLLWRHPVLGRNKAWWWTGGVWSLLVALAVIGGNGEEVVQPKALSLRQANNEAGGPTFDDGGGAREAVLDGPPGQITPEAVLAIVKPFDVAGIDYSKGPKGEPLVEREGYDEDAKKPTTESGFVGPDRRFILHGPRTTWLAGRSSGRKLFESYYFGGERHGVYREWRDTGEKKFEWTYKQGKSHGIGIWYYKDGTIGAIGELKDDNKNGLTFKWHGNGQIESVERIRTDVVNGEAQSRLEGKARSWFNDGSPNTEASYNGNGNIHGRRIEHLPKGRPVETLWDDGRIVFDRSTCNMRTLHERMKASISTHDGEGAKFIIKSADEFFRRVGPPDPGSVKYNNHDSDDVPWGLRCTYRCSDGVLSVLVRSISGNVMAFVNPEDTLR